MGSSYLPSGVMVNCTLMQVTKPQNLGISRASDKRTVKTSNGTALILNIDDKKINLTFNCKSPAKFWDGLGSLCKGLAIGILCVAVAVVVVAAVVGTGGLAGVVLGAMAEAAASAVTGYLISATAAAAIVLPLIGEYKQTHECDCTLAEGSKWQKVHTSVKINGNSAVLQRSFLKCTKGGLIQPFISAVIAQDVAKKFSEANAKELEEHNQEQATMGFVTGFTALGDPLGTGVGIYFAVKEYNDGNDDATLANEGTSEEQDYETDLHNSKRDNEVATAAGAAKGSLIDVRGAMAEQDKGIIKEVMDQGGTYEQGKELTVFGEKTYQSEFMHAGAGLGVGLGFGIAGAVGNHYIAGHYKDEKLHQIEEVKDLRRKMQARDNGNNIGVLANNPDKEEE